MAGPTPEPEPGPIGGRTSWDPDLYGRFAAERARPVHDMLARIEALDASHPVHPATGAWAPSTVVDLGCGPGHLTAWLARRWPGATVLGLDSSPSMMEAAGRVRAEQSADVAARLTFAPADAASWTPPERVDLILTNAVLQWVPGHLRLLPGWVEALAPGGVLAMSVPADFDAPLHSLLRETALEQPWADRVGRVRDHLAVHPVAEYVDVLAGAGAGVDAWETTYQHLLDPVGELGDDAVLTWISGTGMRPVTDALADDPAMREAFVARYAARLRQAYPRRPYGTPLAFARRFALARAVQPAPLGRRSGG